MALQGQAEVCTAPGVYIGHIELRLDGLFYFIAGYTLNRGKLPKEKQARPLTTQQELGEFYQFLFCNTMFEMSFCF